jgi:hypothetical protein
VTGTATAVITGSAGGVKRTATLTVTPAGGGGGGFVGPTANAADTGGDGNGFQTTPANAHGDDAASAVDTNSGSANGTGCASASRDKHRFFDYGLSVPGGSSVAGIEVRLDARADATGGNPRMCVQLSWNGGTSWTAAKITPSLTTSMATYVLGGPADGWGRTWTPAQLSNANFRVRVTNIASSTARDFSLDWIAVRVTTGGPAPTPTITTPPTATLTPTRTPTLGTPPPTATRTPTRTPSRTPTPGAPPPTATPTPAVALDITLTGVPASIPRGDFFTATATVTNTGSGSASGYSVRATFTPTDSMRLENPQTATQTLPAVPPGESRSVAWLIRADKAATATLTMTLLAPGGATVDTASRTVTITD